MPTTTDDADAAAADAAAADADAADAEGDAAEVLLKRAEAAFERGDFKEARRLGREWVTSHGTAGTASADQRARIEALARKLTRDYSTVLVGIVGFVLLLAVFSTYVLS